MVLTKEDWTMARKRHTAEEIVGNLRQDDVLMAQGKPVADAVRMIGVTEVTYYRWRNEYGGLKGDPVKRLKELETENGRLRRPVFQRFRATGLILLIPAVKSGSGNANLLQRLARRHVRLFHNLDDLSLLGGGVSHVPSSPSPIMLF
jgi:putative transposase